MEIIKNTEDYQTEKVNLFGNCEKVLDYLSEGRVFNICYEEKKRSFVLYEECDQYFGVDLTVENCRDLAELFTKIADKLEENNIK